MLVDVDSCADEQPAAPLREERAPAPRPTPDEHQALGEQLPRDAQREAPSATRTLSSWRRAAARASSRLAMLAQAMSRTRPTTTMMVVSGRR